MKNNLISDNIPNECGVYFFKRNDEILYVGKAKKLKTRLNQYFNGSINSYKTPLLIEKANKIDFLICTNEKEALLLEQEMIKKYKPYFNILFLDDKKYPYIVIELKKDKLEFKTKFFYRKEKKSYYYGPLPPNYGYKTIKNFLIRECLFENGLPIKNKDENFWKEKFEYAKSIISSSNDEIIKKLKIQMINEAKQEHYEIAKDYRDVIEHLNSKIQNQSIKFENEKDFDIIVFKTQKNYLLINVNYFKNGSFFMQEDFCIEINISEYQSCISFINYFYTIRNMPSMLVTNMIELNQNDIIFDKKILIPKKGQYYQAVQNALRNIENKQEYKILSIKNKSLSFDNIKNFFNQMTKKEIKDFIVIDNSHESNKDIVSVIIYYRNFQPFFPNYRKYLINSKNQNKLSDDKYIEIGLTKYLDNKNEIPDLFIVDGSIQQLEAARKVLQKHKIDKPILGLVKNEKHQSDHIIFEKKPIKIPSKDIYNFISKIQTEVDQYAKKYHRKVKLDSSLEGVLLTIEGIGLKTEKKLLDYFKSYSNIYNASEEQLSKIVSKTIAKKIKEKLKK